MSDIHFDPVKEHDAEQVRTGFGRRLLLYTAAYLPGLFRPSVWVMSLLVCVPLAVLGYYSLWSFREMELTGGVCFTALLIVLFAHIVGWMMTGSVQMLNDTMLELEGRWGTFMVVSMFPLAMLIFLAWLVGPIPD